MQDHKFLLGKHHSPMPMPIIHNILGVILPEAEEVKNFFNI